MFINEDQLTMMETCLAARDNARSHEAKKVDAYLSFVESVKRADSGRDLYDPYDAIVFEGKMKIDMFYFNQLLSKIEETYVPAVQSLIVEAYKDVRRIYELTNIKPEVYGSGISYAIINESNNSIQQKLSESIYNFFETKFYRLDAAQRKDKYIEECREIAKSLITEGVKSEPAMEYAIKTRVVEDLLESIAFPFSVYSRIKYLVEADIEYSKVFDSEKLNNLLESYNQKCFKLAKMIATTI